MPPSTLGHIGSALGVIGFTLIPRPGRSLLFFVLDELDELDKPTGTTVCGRPV